MATNDGAGAPKRDRKPYPPMPAENLKRLQAYLDQAEAHRLNPALSPPPDIHLLALTPWGPFTTIWIAPDPETSTGRLVVHFKVQNGDRGPRYCPPEAFAVTALLLAYGGGLNCNDNRGQWSGSAYLRLHGGNDRVMLDRVLTDAGVGEVVLQDPGADHHDYDPGNFRKVPVEAVRAEGDKPMKTPKRGRAFALGKSRQLYRTNRHLSDAGLSERQYVNLLQRGFRLLDAYRLRREGEPSPTSISVAEA